MSSRYDPHALVGAIAEGRADEVLKRQAAYNHKEFTPPPFVRYVVLEVISDPATLDNVKLSHFEHDLGVANIQYANVAPRNAIIGRRVMGGDSTASEKVMVLYPFFPPHMALPAKAGEHVWVMFENPDAKSNDLGYWFCRIVQPNFVEDPNHTHADRQHDQSFIPSNIDVATNNVSPVYDFPNGVVQTKNGDRFTLTNTATLPDDPNAYKNLLTTTDASKITQYEAVPRYRKRPADFALEGSNNTLIVLGTDRTGPAADYTSDPNQGMVPQPVTTDTLGPGAGAIDIVVGRGQTSATAGKLETNVLGNTELGKAPRDLVPNEGDVDLVNDRSRLLVAQKTKPDTNFGTAGVISGQTSVSQVTDGNGEGAVVVKTDKIRLIARQDVVILVTGATSTDGNGNLQDDSPLDASKCASVVIRTNGDIVFTPAANGVIKLGSDNAKLAVLCAQAVTGAGDGSGQVTATPVTDSMGGSLGAGAANGVYATKVLLS